MPNRTLYVSVRTETIWNRAKDEAAREHRSISDVIAELLEDYVKEREWSRETEPKPHTPR